MKNKRSMVRLLKWLVSLGLVGAAVLFVYCASLFQELEPLMAETPKLQPTTLYSDLFFLNKGTSYSETFLTERLKDLRIPFTESPGSAEAPTVFEWKSRSFDFPEAILATGSPSRLSDGQTVKVSVKEDRIDSIAVDAKEVDSIAIEPTPVAQISGSNRSIRNYVKLDDIPTKLLQAIIAIEDQRFLEHHGFDLRSLARAVYVNIRSRAMSQGGSTLTQQLIKNLLGTRQKTLFRKLRELVLAILMEARYSKDIILEKYLNEVYFGQIGSLEVHGVAEAARYFYAKPLASLSLAEMAMIAGVIRGPVVYSPYKNLKKGSERKDTVLRKMEELKIITPTELAQALAEKLSFAPVVMGNNKAPYFADYVKSQLLDLMKNQISAEDLSAAGLKVFTTVDLPLQRRADQAVATTVRELEAKYKIERPLRLEGLLVAAEHKTGFVRAIVGGRSYAETTYNRVLNMKRQVGSTFKPIAYLSALQKGSDESGNTYSPAYMIDDEPWKYKWGRGSGERSWTPHNYEKGFRGHITLREAFINSINIPMAKIAIDTGIENIVETAHKLGVEESLPAVPSLILGSIDLKPFDLLQVYSTFANRGDKVPLSTIRFVAEDNGRPLLTNTPPAPVQVFEKSIMDVLGELLKSVVKEGTGKTMPLWGYKKTARGKTGTTSFSRDAWFAGFSQGLATVTWTGFDELKIPDSDDDDAPVKFKSPAPLTGAGSALPTWARFYAAAKPAALEEIDPPLDSGVETRKIDRTTGLLAKPSCPTENVDEDVFLAGTAPTEECGAH